MRRGAEFVATPEELCQRADVDFLDVCTFPGYRLAAVELGAKSTSTCLCRNPWRSISKRRRA